MRFTSLAIAGLSIVIVTAASAPSRAATGYLDTARRPDAAAFISPPPAPGSPEAKADIRAFKVTRRLKGSERWSLAAHDAVYDAPVVLGDFACAIGVRLDAGNAPRLLAMIENAQEDSAAVVRSAKKRFKRLRPIEGNHAPFCVDRKGYAGSLSYPSGHGSMIGTVTLILAELAPDRADAIAERGRVYAESRVACGAHWASDLDAGVTAGAVLVATLHADSAFRADMEAARAEVVTARQTADAPDPGQCRIEAAAAAHRPW